MRAWIRSLSAGFNCLFTVIYRCEVPANTGQASLIKTFDNYTFPELRDIFGLKRLRWWQRTRGNRREDVLSTVTLALFG